MSTLDLFTFIHWFYLLLEWRALYICIPNVWLGCSWIEFRSHRWVNGSPSCVYLEKPDHIVRQRTMVVQTLCTLSLLCNTDLLQELTSAAQQEDAVYDEIYPAIKGPDISVCPTYLAGNSAVLYYNGEFFRNISVVPNTWSRFMTCLQFTIDWFSSFPVTHPIQSRDILLSLHSTAKKAREPGEDIRVNEILELGKETDEWHRVKK